jgi:hypothetical protein
VDFLLQQLEAAKSEALTAYLAAMSRFHYSFGNILEIARQKPMQPALPECIRGTSLAVE